MFLTRGGEAPSAVSVLGYVSDETNQRRVLVQLNREQARHHLDRAVFHGRRGDL